MSFMSGVKKSAQASVKRVREEAKPVAPSKPQKPSARAVRDAFEAQQPRAKVELKAEGVTVTALTITVAHSDKKGSSLSTSAFGDTLGVSFTLKEPVASLGAVGVKAGGREFVMGLVPAAPAPLPLVVYAGKERK